MDTGASRTKRRGGIAAKAFGELFERLFLVSCRSHGVAITRIPDGCKQVSAHRLVRVQSPFDWVITSKSRTALIDTKTSQSKVFAHSQIVEHQVREMRQHEVAGTFGGYVIWLRQTNEVLFVRASILESLMQVEGSICRGSPYSTYLGSSQTLDVALLFSGSV